MEKLEINDKNKVKFFAQYWGQRVFVNPILSVTPVRNTFVFDYPNPEDIEEEYLLLKSLSSIGVLEFKELGLGFGPWESEEIDLLRFKGYAMPWMGISVEEMVEAGWVKLERV